MPAPRQSIDLMIKKVSVHDDDDKFNTLKMTDDDKWWRLARDCAALTPAHEHLVKYKARRSLLTLLGTSA